MGSCHAKRKRGPRYEIECVRKSIVAKEKKGQDASFERSLLKSWAGYEGYESAKRVLAQLPDASQHS